MIRHLRIRDFILIEELELELGEGFYALTGETGAGKTVLARAVELLRGGRFAAEWVRQGAEEAAIEAILEPGPGSSAWPRLREAGLPEGDGTLVVRRVGSRSGRSRVYLNGALANAAQLAEVVGPLIDVASQHEHQSLGQVANHLEALDAFGGHEPLREAMAEAHGALVGAARQQKDVRATAQARAEREDFLRFQLAQIEQVAPEAGEEERLAQERERLRAAEKLAQAARRGEELLYSGEEAAADRVAQVSRELAQLGAIDPALAPIARQLEEARVVLEEGAFALRRYAGTILADPERKEQIEERLEGLRKLLRKHGSTVAELLVRRDEMAAELSGLEQTGIRREEAARWLEQARAVAAERAKALSVARAGAAKKLAVRVMESLAEMQMGGARFEVRVEHAVPRENESPEAIIEGARVGPTGFDRVEFLIETNRGAGAHPLAKIASGGELSRVMLALKLATAKGDAVATYVFDEVDAGVGGAVAETVGRLIRSVSSHRQVLAITHLPQIAACADVHLQVEKRDLAGKTVQRVRQLSEGARRDEMARMMAGVEITAKARAHAAEMLKRARG